MNTENDENDKDLIYPYVIFIEYDPASDCPKTLCFGDYNQAEKEFRYCREVYSCKIEFYQQDMNECRIKTFATYYGN